MKSPSFSSIAQTADLTTFYYIIIRVITVYNKKARVTTADLITFYYTITSLTTIYNIITSLTPT
jgi:hypothetical protein